jgi:hemolysin D
LIGAEEAQAHRNQLSADIIRARNNALLAYLDGRPSIFHTPPGTPADVAETQRQFIQTSIAQYEAERAALVQSKAEQRAQLAASEAELAKLHETLPLIEKQLSARNELSGKGFFPKLKALEYEQLRVEHIHNIDVQESNAARARAAIANFDAQIHRLREAFGKEAISLLSEASDKSALAAEDLRKAEQRREFQQLKSPVAGTVQQLAVTTVGGVVQPAQPLMVIVPDDAPLAVDAMILNRDIGFVREGQPVRVKLEAFPFTDYGLLEGEVESISRDAIEQNQQQNNDGKANVQQPPQPGLIYAVRVRLKQKTLLIAGREQPVGPGLAVQAEIKTGERRIIQYMLSPIARALDEAGRER